MAVILAALIPGIVGIASLGRSLESRQRIGLVVTFSALSRIS
jgi:hypothetical protein